MNTWRAVLEHREAFMTSDVARLATELQRTGLSRTEALREAERLQAKYGPGLTLHETTTQQPQKAAP